MASTNISATEIDSTFEGTETDPAVGVFRATHASGEYTVRREYRPHVEAGTLEIYSEYYADGTLVQSDTRRLVEDGRPSSCPEDSIAAFCRADHYENSENDIRTASEAADRYTRASESYPRR